MDTLESNGECFNLRDCNGCLGIIGSGMRSVEGDRVREEYVEVGVLNEDGVIRKIFKKLLQYDKIKGFN